ncbi:MAG: hypothetical protein B6U87_01435 [Candidatus Aenigmarchaeota archaeon ex4484_52]|nr:MAG: hypothetical protein B6U87_01435 [Candidatus Aenigmarchaeota archaeon ex4484_52]
MDKIIMVSKDFKKISLGIAGINKLLGGGIPENSVVLVSGGAGCGKTTFLCQYINEGLKRGETCLFVSLEESKEQIKQDAIQFGWDFDKYEKKDKLYLKQYNPFEVSSNIGLNSFERYIEYIKAKRVVIDPITLFAEFITNEGVDDKRGEYAIRRGIFNVISILKKLNVTAVLSGEIIEGSKYKLSKYGEEEFVVDGVIVLTTMDGVGKRTLCIKKMRSIKHDFTPKNFKITDKGIVVETE